MSKRNSRVWMFFEQLDNDSRKVKSSQCQMIISRGGQGKAANTTSMNNHIKYRHPTLISQLGSAIKCSTTDDSSQSQIQAEKLHTTVPTVSTSVSSEVSLCQKNQQNIEDSFAVQWSRENLRSREINIAIGEMIAVDKQPLSIVENSGFRNLMRKLKPKYNIPGRKYFTENIIPQLYEETKSEIQRGVMSAAAISVTTDMWTNINNKESFLSFTAHWIDDSLQYHQAVLQMKHFPETHTVNNIKNCLEEIPTLWDIDMAKIHAVVRDNGRNVTKAIDDSVFKGVPCFIHTIQLAINTALKNNTIAQVLVKSRRICDTL